MGVAPALLSPALLQKHAMPLVESSRVFQLLVVCALPS